MPIHSDDFIRKRREQVAALLAKGVAPRSVSSALVIPMRVVYRDIKWLNKENEQRMFEMAKQTIPTLFSNCLEAMNQLIEQCWNMYVRSNMKVKRDSEGKAMRDAEGNIVEEMVEPIDRISQSTRLQAIKIAGELTDMKFNMIQNGPAMFELKKLEQKVNELRSGIELPV